MSFSLRSAAPHDIEPVLVLAAQLAAETRTPIYADPDAVRSALFGPVPKAQLLIAQDTAPGAQAPSPPLLGFAVWFYDFDIVRGSPGLHIGDLYLAPNARGQGIALALFRLLARRAVEESCAEIRWSPRVGAGSGLNLYQSLSAIPVGSWTSRRLAGAALHALAG